MHKATEQNEQPRRRRKKGRKRKNENVHGYAYKGRQNSLQTEFNPFNPIQFS